MNLKKLSILVVILVLLGVYFYFYEVKTGREKAKAKEEAKKIVVFKPEHVEELVLKTEEKLILLHREEDQWMIKEPVVAKGDNDSIGAALITLAKAETERTVNEKPENLQVYGLDKPSMEIIIKEKNHPPLDTIFLGSKNPTEYYVYMKMAKSSAVMLTSSGLKDQLDKDVYHYRDKTLLDIDVEDVNRLSIKYKGMKADLEKDIEGDWRIIGPIQATADGGIIRRLMYSLKNSRINAFVDESPNGLKKYGLDSPDMEVFFSGKNKSLLKSLLIGIRAETDGDFYAKWKNAVTVFLIPEDFSKDYPNTLFDLRDKTVLDFEKEEVVRIELKYPDEEMVVVSDEENQWNMIKPLKVKADEFAVSDLLWALLDIQADGFVNGSTEDIESYGLKKPYVEANVWEKGKKNPIQLFIGKKTEGEKHYYAGTNLEKAVYKLSPEVLKDLKKTPFDLRDKTLLTFNNEDVGKIRVRYQDKNLILKLEKGDWKAIEPEKATLYKPEVISFLWDIKLLKFTEILSSEGRKQPTPTYGFDSPETEITLWNNEESKIGSIEIGKKMPGKDILYAKVDSATTVYGIGPEFLEKLPHGVADLK